MRAMRIAFYLALLAGGALYARVAFAELDFLTRSGRPGPGFFPRIIGASLIAATLWALLDSPRASERGIGVGGSLRDLVPLLALAIGYAALLRLTGWFPATFAFLAAALSFLNRGRHIQNASIAVGAPIGIYILFDRLLNASMPPAPPWLPF